MSLIRYLKQNILQEFFFIKIKSHSSVFVHVYGNKAYYDHPCFYDEIKIFINLQSLDLCPQIGENSSEPYNSHVKIIVCLNE